ncbi:MAG TPA: tetratricopeptide repeat protein [Pyrinomonadaceae bacterium]|jgi:serine/threonine-protein kinase
MQSENWKKVKELLDEVLSREASERRPFLENCGAGIEILSEVESLLAFEEESEDLMRLSAVEFSRDFFDEDADNLLIGQTVGNYKIVRELGQGGMGAVYLAERADGKFAQRAALKLLKREMNTAALRRRFQHEREILASLEHPNIARLLDAGTTDDKIPFLAMEYVEGLPLDEYCSNHKLDLNQRLDLFRKVSAAVNFAHRNLVVHRDLKPSNILVTADGTPKLLDFGISKILSAELENAGSATVTGLGVMTPSYASPEQLQNKSVTTATDIYSLGVILYELLSGQRPFEAKEGDLKEICRAVIETEPKPPSAVISDSGFRISDLEKKSKSKSNFTKNQNQKTNPKSRIPNPKSIMGDLDNIVLKALRKEPERRYSSAENLAEDIHRHQRGLPVTARPNTFSYRAEKFFKRNRAGVIAGTLIVLAIIGGIIATFRQSRIAALERDRARLEAAKAEKINSFLQNVLTLSNPLFFSENPERNLKATVAEAVDEAAGAVETELEGQPEIQAEIHYTLGKTYMGQGQFEKARAQLEKARENFLRLSPDNLPKAMQINSILGSLIFFEGKEDDSEKMLAESVRYFRENLEKKAENKFWLAMSLSDLGAVISRKGRISESEKLFHESLDYGSTLDGQDRWLTINIMGNLGDILVEQGKIDEAIGFYQKSIEEGRKLSDKPRTEIGNQFYDLGRVYKRLEKYDLAQENIQKAYEIFKETIGEEHIYTAMARKQIAELYYLRGDYAKARAEIDEVLKVIRRVAPEQPNLYTIYSEEVLANVLTKTGEAEKAENIMREVVAAYKKLLESPHPDIASAKKSLGETLFARKKFAEARQVLTESEKEFVATVGADNPETRKCREILSRIPE